MNKTLSVTAVFTLLSFLFYPAFIHAEVFVPPEESAATLVTDPTQMPQKPTPAAEIQGEMAEPSLADMEKNTLSAEESAQPQPATGKTINTILSIFNPQAPGPVDGVNTPKPLTQAEAEGVLYGVSENMRRHVTVQYRDTITVNGQPVMVNGVVGYQDPTNPSTPPTREGGAAYLMENFPESIRPFVTIRYRDTIVVDGQQVIVEGTVTYGPIIMNGKETMGPRYVILRHVPGPLTHQDAQNILQSFPEDIRPNVTIALSNGYITISSRPPFTHAQAQAIIEGLPDAVKPFVTVLSQEQPAPAPQ